jgi:hypothetical protein
MSRGCPPELRKQRDWDALPEQLRVLVTEIRGIKACLPWADAVMVDGRAPEFIVFSRGNRWFALNGLQLRIFYGATAAQILVEGLRLLGVEPPDVI